jgi:hypothetical protein
MTSDSNRERLDAYMSREQYVAWSKRAAKLEGKAVKNETVISKPPRETDGDLSQPVFAAPSDGRIVAPRETDQEEDGVSLSRAAAEPER